MSKKFSRREMLRRTGQAAALGAQEFPKEALAYLSEIGFKVQSGEGAKVSAVTREGKTGECRAVMR
jgi:hypothetical protein